MGINKEIYYHDSGETIFPEEMPEIFLRFDLKFNPNSDSYYKNPPDSPILTIQNQVLFFATYFIEDEKEYLPEALKQIDKKLAKLDLHNIATIFENIMKYKDVCSVLFSLNSFKKVLSQVNIKENEEKINEIIDICKKKLKKNEEIFLPFLQNSLNFLLTLILVATSIDFNDFEKIYSSCPKRNLEDALSDEILKNNIFFKNQISFANFRKLFPKNFILENIRKMK